MNAFTHTLISSCLTLAAGGALAQDAMKNDSMSKDGMMKKEMTMKECKSYMAMSKRADKAESMAKDDAKMKKDEMCAEMMMKDGAASAPMKK